MACDTCASIASTTGKGSLVEKQERSVLVKCGSLQKSTVNGCLSCSLIQGIVEAGKSRESNVESLRVRVDKDGSLSASVTYLPTDGSHGILEQLYPFTVQGNTLSPYNSFNYYTSAAMFITNG